MKRNNKKAFTLVELLAAITILAIILTITAFTAADIINDARANSTKVSVKSYISAVNTNIINAKLNSANIDDGAYKILENGSLCIGTYSDSNCDGEVLNIDVKKAKPSSGVVVISDKRVTSVINASINGETISYDAVKDEELAFSKPTIVDFNVVRYTNSLKLEYTITNAKSFECVYGTTNSYGKKGIISDNKNECIINNLAPNQTYYYKLIAKNSSDEVVREGTATTLPSASPMITVAPNGYGYIKTAMITYANVNLTDPNNYIYTTSSATSNANVVECGTGTEPGDCSATPTMNLKANIWYKTSGSTINLTYNMNSMLIATTYEGDKLVGTAQAIITSIDSNKPVIEVNNAVYGEPVNISIYDNQSGVKYFAVTETNEAPNETLPNEVNTGSVVNKWYTTEVTTEKKTVTFTGLDAKTYYAWGKDELGNYSSVEFIVRKSKAAVSADSKTAEYTGGNIPVDDLTPEVYPGTTYTYYNSTNCTGSVISRPINAGTYSLKITIPEADNYYGETKCIVFTIEKATPQITKNINSVTTVKDKNVTLTLKSNVAGTFGIVSNDTGVVTVSTASISASANQTYTVTLRTIAVGETNVQVNFTPTNTNNYKTVSSLIGVKVIDSALVPTTANNCKSNLKYTGTTQTLTNNFEGIIYTNNTGKNAGTYTITASLDPSTGLVWSDETTGNKTFTCEIAKADDVITITETSATYNKTSKNASVNVQSGLTPTITYYSNSSCTSEKNPVDAGTYYVIVSTAGNANYKSKTTSCTKAITINKATLTPSASCSSKIYDASTSASCNISLATILSGDDVTASKVCTFENATAQSNKTVTCRDITLDGSSKDNYSLSSSTATATATIMQRQVNAPTNLNISTAGIVTWINSSNATGYQISIDGTNYTNATSGVNYLSTITAETGERIVYVRAINSDSTNYSTPGTAVSKKVNVYTLTVRSNNTNYGVVVPSSFNFIKGTTYQTGSNLLNLLSGSNLVVTIAANPTNADGYDTNVSWSSSSGTLNGNATITATFTRNPKIFEITLDNQSATTAGTAKIYEKYNTGYYLNSAAITAMTTSANGITVPQKNGYTFGGYYTGQNGSGTQFIGTNGKLTSSASTTQFSANGSLYAKWTDTTKPDIVITHTGSALSGTITDAGSGVVAYAITDSNETPADNSSDWISVGNNPVASFDIPSTNHTSGARYIHAKDAAGNTKVRYTSVASIGMKANETYTQNYTASVNGMTCESSNTNLATCALSQDGTTYTVTITSKSSEGSPKIKVKYSDGSIYRVYNVSIDVTAPTPTITGGTTLKTASQPVTLKCSDNAEVTAYYFGTTNPTSIDSITTTTSLSSLTGNGLSQNITASGTYYLACRDSAGNFEKTNIIIRKYEVQNVLITTSGTAGTYTSDNYVTSGSTSTYYVKDGTSLTLANTYTTTDATGSFLGYTTAAPSATAQTPSTTAPTVSNNTTKYYMWFNRSTFTVTLNAGANGSLKGESIDLAGNATANAGGSNTITVRYGEKIKATATPQTGYSFNGFSGGYLSGTTNPQTGAAITSNITITASWKDTNPPSLTLSKQGAVNGFNGWKLTSTASLDLTNQMLSLNSTGGAAMSPYYQVDEQNYGWSYDFQSSSAATNRPNGGDYTGTRYFDSKFNAYTGANGYAANGQSTNAPALNTWKSVGPTNYNQGTGIEYFNIDLKLNAAYSTPVTKYRNFKVYGDIYAKDKYTISLTASDAEGSIATKKYASGSQSVAYFANSGTAISGNSFDVTANGTYTVYVADNAGNGTVKTISVDKIDKTAPTITSFVGKMLNTDPTFASGTNSASIYNNSGGGTVTVNRVANSEWPDGSGYVLEVKTTGTASPGIGGFVQYTQSYANGEFYHVIVAKVPVGYSIEHAENATGNGRTIEWLTSTAGTGKFETYIYKHKCGSSGTFSSFGHVYLIGNAATSSNPVTWYVAYSSMFDVTNTDPTTNYIVSYANDATSGIVSYAYTTSNSQPTSWKLTQTSKYAVNVYPITSNSTYYAWFMDAAGNVASKSVASGVKPVKIYYHPNGGTVGSSSYTTCNNGWVCTNSTTYFVQTKDFGSSGDLYNTTTFGISRTGYSIPDGTEWCTQMDGGGTCFDHDVSYTYATYKNAAQKNLTDNYELDLYTHWNPNTYTISLNANGGSGGTSSVNIVYNTTQGNYPSITAPTRNGYTFNGFWDTSAASGGTQWYNSAGNSLRTFNLTSNTTWYARWSPNTYYVTYDANGGTGAPAKQSFVFDSGATLSTTKPTRAGYAFVNWKYSNGTQTFNPGDAIPSGWGTFTLVAQWTSYKLTLKYNVNGGSIETGTGTERWRASNSLVQRSTNSGSSWSDITATLDITTKHVDLWNVGTYGATKTGYHIDAATAYNTKTDGTGVNIHQDDYTSNSTNSVTVARLNGGNLTADKTINIYANWKINTNTLTVNPNGGSVTFNGASRTSATSATQNYNTTIAVPNASGKANSSSTANKAITFNQNGGTYNSSTSSTTVNSTETTTTTYSFSSWSNSGTCGSMSGTTYTFPSNNGTTCTKTASWSSSSSKSYSAITAQAAPSKAGNSFAGWYTAASGGTYIAGASGTISAATVKSLVDNGTTTLYAHWTPLALTMSAPTPTGTAATGTGTTKTAGFMVGATVTFTCSGQSGNYPSSLQISGQTAVSNSSNASSISATYTINSPSTSFTISATCTGAQGNTLTVSSTAKPIYRKFQLLYEKNGASAIGSTSSSVQTLAANSTSADGGSTFTLPSSITCVNNGRSCGSLGWDLTTTTTCPRFAKSAKVNVCTSGTSGCSGTGSKSSAVPGSCSSAGSSGTIELGASYTARYVYAVTYSQLNNPTKLASAISSSSTITKNDGNVYMYNGSNSTSTSFTMKNRCINRSDGKKTFAFHAGGGTYNAGAICTSSQSSCSKTASDAIFKQNYSFGCMGADGSTFTSTF